MQSTPLWPLLPGPLWPRVVAPDKVPIYGLNKTKLCFLHYTDFCIVFSNTHSLVNKVWTTRWKWAIQLCNNVTEYKSGKIRAEYEQELQM